MKIAYQGIAGSYSESCAKTNYKDCETVPCRTFQDAFEMAKNDSNVNHPNHNWNVPHPHTWCPCIHGGSDKINSTK